MEKQKKTNGIILRRFDLNEADQIITVLTEDEGKIALIAKGSRRLKSRFCGRLEPFYHVSLQYFQGKELGHLNEAELMAAPWITDGDLKRHSLLFFMAEVTLKMLPDGQECRDIYKLLKDFLLHLEMNREDALLPAYLIKLLTMLGFMAPWNMCHKTEQKINLNQPYFFSAIDGGISELSSSHVQGMRLSPSVIKWVSYMQQEDFRRLKNIIPTTEEKERVLLIIQLMLSNLLHHPFRSQHFLERVNGFY